MASTSYRDAVKVQYSTLVQGIVNTVRAHSGVPNLRTYWYDASRDGLLTDEHKKIAMITGLKVRLGRLNYFGEQKGVDLRLALDLVGLARTGAASVAYLVSGDDDLTEAVEEAQSLGIRVVLLGISDETSRIGVTSVADNLAYSVDAIEHLPEDLLKRSFTRSLSHNQELAHVASTIAEAGHGTRPEGADGDAVIGAGVERDGIGGAAGSAVGGAIGAGGTGKSGVPTTADDDDVPGIIIGGVKVPTPSALAKQVSGEAKSATRETPTSTVVYSSRTGEPGNDTEDAGYNPNSLTAHELKLVETAEQIGAKVAGNWYASTTQAELTEVVSDRPQIPAMIDRILIKDCAREIGEHDTYLKSIRQALRRAFWEEIDRLN